MKGIITIKFRFGQNVLKETYRFVGDSPPRTINNGTVLSFVNDEDQIVVVPLFKATEVKITLLE